MTLPSSTDPTNPYGLTGDDLAQYRASEANAKAIDARRRDHARRLLAPQGPLRATSARWSAVLHPDRATPPDQWGPAPGALSGWQGEGPPPETIPGAQVGDLYRDTLTDDLYELKAD